MNTTDKAENPAAEPEHDAAAAPAEPQASHEGTGLDPAAGDGIQAGPNVLETGEFEYTGDGDGADPQPASSQD